MSALPEFNSNEAKDIVKNYCINVSTEQIQKFGSDNVNFSNQFIDVGVEKFSEWISSKANPKLAKFTYVCAQFAILEAAENIFHYGAGFTKLDLTGFTLKQILDIVKKIANDVEVILNAPQKETVLHFQSIINMIQHDRNEEAYDKLKLVDEKGTQAVVYADRKSISVQVYEETLKVVHILISSKILFFGYDKEKKFFLPTSILDENTRILIGKEIEKLVNMSFDLQKKVETGKKYFKFIESADKKNKVQNLLDSILSTAYPFIRYII